MNTKNRFPSPSEYVAKNRAVLRPGEYFILPKENRCPSPQINARHVDEQVFVTPKLGAGYVMSELFIQPDGGATIAISRSLEHFFFILEGKLNLNVGKTRQELPQGSFAWIPPHHAIQYSATDNSTCRAIWFRRQYNPLPGIDIPQPVFGNERDVPAIPEVDLNPEKQLIPYSNLGIDMAFNLIVCPPGSYYGLVECHAWEHAMYMLNGEGMLFLNGNYHHVKEGDFIYIAPFCPEWFGALGITDQPVQFLLYWDCNRDYSPEID